MRHISLIYKQLSKEYVEILKNIQRAVILLIRVFISQTSMRYVVLKCIFL